MKQRLFVYFFLFLFASILNSCNKGNEDVRFISRYENLNPIVAKAAQWYDSQELIMDFIDNKSPAWNNAVIKKTPDGFPLIVVQIYSGKNINGLDSIQEIFVVVKDDFYKGTVRIRSSYTKERAQVAFYTLNGRMLESGDLYIPTEAYSMLQKYVLNTFVLMGFEEGPIYYTRTMVPGSETYRWEYGYNPNAYNCHQYVWGDPDPGSPFYDPLFPHWNNFPVTWGYREMSSSEAAQVGDRVIYYGGGAIYGDRFAIHSAFVTGVDAQGRVTEVTGKWGEDGIYSHHPANGHYSYGQNRVYYRAY